jgi:hypothetical protein
MPISINGSGTITGISVGGLPDGCVQLADLATTGTASSSTFLRGDAAFAEAGGGKVLKHYYNSYDTSTSMGGASSYSMYGGLVATFTPSAASSLLLVTMVQAGQHIITSDPDVSMKYRIKRTIASGTETDIYEIDYVADRATSNARHFHHVPMTILDNPTYNLGESIVYKPFISKYTANYGTTYQAQYGDTRSHVTILELAAN